MKDFLTNANVVAVILAIVSIIETIMLCIVEPLNKGLIILLGILSIVTIIMNRFAYQIAKHFNKRFSLYYKKRHDSETDEDYEPSNFAILRVKLPCYVLLAMQTVMLFVFSIY